LSKNQPFCDGTHKAAKTEAPDKFYWYDSEGSRHDVKENYPDIRAPLE
jgi:CDGSH-type Zn-finger protein